MSSRELGKANWVSWPNIGWRNKASTSKIQVENRIPLKVIWVVHNSWQNRLISNVFSMHTISVKLGSVLPEEYWDLGQTSQSVIRGGAERLTSGRSVIEGVQKAEPFFPEGWKEISYPRWNAVSSVLSVVMVVCLCIKNHQKISFQQVPI